MEDLGPLVGYLGHFTNPIDPLAGLALLAPLYGTVALLIREVTRRAGRGWPTILLLSAAAGLVQAGLIDQTLFDHTTFEGGPYWEVMPTFVPWLDVDLSQLLVFVGGHMVVSFAGPIAVMEAFAGTKPWLRRPGLLVTALVYVAAGLFFWSELVVVEGFDAGPVRLGVTALVVIFLVVLAFAIPFATPVRGRAPHVWLVGVVTFVLWTIHFALRETVTSRPWVDVAVAIVVLAFLGWVLLRWSRQEGWTGRHTFAAGSVVLVVQGGVAFLVAPVDSDDWAGKYLSNAVVLGCLLALLASGWLRVRRSSPAPERRPESMAG